MKFKTILTLLFGVSTSIINNVNAQSGFVATGGDASNSSGSISSSVGQIDYVYSASNEGSISQGIQQSYTVEDVSSLTEENEFAISIFPNPTTDILSIMIDESLSNYSINLYDNQGKLVEHIQVSELITEINMTSLSNAYYSLEINKDDQKLKIYKIIKN